MDPGNASIGSDTPVPASSAPTNLLTGAAAPAVVAPPLGGAPEWQWTDKDGNWSEGWTGKLGDEFKDNPTLSTIKSPKDLANAYLKTKEFVGKKFDRPGQGAKPEEVAAWRKLVGAPESPDAYGSLMPADFQKDLWDGEMEKEFVALAHEHHLPPDTAKAIAGLHAKSMAGVYEKEVAAAQQRLAAGKDDLQKSWGPDFDRNLTNVKALADYFGIPHDHDLFLHPDVVKAFAAKAPGLLGGDQVVKGSPAAMSGGIEGRINAIHNSPAYLGQEGTDAQKKAADELRSLYAAQTRVKAA